MNDGGKASVILDLTCDLMDEDETGYVWTFLREARDPVLIEPGAIVVVGDSDAPAVAEVVDVVEKPAGPVVHLRALPGTIEDYAALIRRAIHQPESPSRTRQPPPRFLSYLRKPSHRRSRAHRPSCRRPSWAPPRARCHAPEASGGAQPRSALGSKPGAHRAQDRSIQ